MNATQETWTQVSLRDVLETDLPIFFQQQLDEQANHMAAFTPKDPFDKEAFMARWGRILANDTIYVRTILEGQQVAGSVLYYEEDDQLEIGYWLGKEYWGRGIASRGLALFLAEVTHRPLYARVAKDNIGSLRVLQKNGFVIVSESIGYANARNAEVEEFVTVLHAH